MATRLEEFVAEELWLLIGVVTFALVSLAGLTGLEGLAGAISIVGWFLLTPLFLFWGEEIADLFFGDEETTPDTENTEMDALEDLKRRYAAGEIDDDEFEHRLERLMSVDDLPDDVFAAGSFTKADVGGSSTETNAGDDRREREYERE
ncbi:SHOCT domain-containing protein [Natronorubrum sp. DTA28]|uniref:SHOCT domain-containing protein n=1 Tax=Natronorubrum sp. DTA28 TaxID=3447019 RepID=UPI003F83A8A7